MTLMKNPVHCILAISRFYFKMDVDTFWFFLIRFCCGCWYSRSNRNPFCRIRVMNIQHRMTNPQYWMVWNRHFRTENNYYPSWHRKSFKFWFVSEELLDRSQNNYKLGNLRIFKTFEPTISFVSIKEVPPRATTTKYHSFTNTIIVCDVKYS